MPQTDQRRQDILEEQRRVDYENARLQKQALVNASNQGDSEDDVNEDEEDEAVALEEAEREQEEEERMEEETQRMLYLRRRQAQQQIIGEAEMKAETLKETKPTLFAYSAPFAIAILKDLLDFVAIGSLPAIGTIVTICFSIAIFFLLLFSKKNKELDDMRLIIRKAVVPICGTVAEGFIFGLNFLPIETMVVYIIYYMDKHSANEQIKQAVTLVETLRKEV